MKKKKKILIYDDQLSGHHLEYIHHLHENACENKDIEFIFAIPPKFNKVKNQLVWKKSDNVGYHFLLSNEINITGNFFIQSYKKSSIARKIALQYSVDEVFFIALMGLLPVLPFIMPKNIKISGIIYLIYLYRWKYATLTERVHDSLKYLLLSKKSNFRSVFILNDKSSSIFLNKKFKTSKFIYLPDPYLPIDESNLQNLREKYNIPHNNIICLHFGGLSVRKGTLKILEAIDILSKYELKDKSFIFAGKVYPDIKEEFYLKYNKLRDKVQILCFDEFCEYSFLGSLCLSSDFILLPYSNTAKSSGIIGYGAQFKIPVVVPNRGLLSKLVRKYKLGYSIDLNSPEEIADSLKKQVANYDRYKESRYIVEHNVSQFNQAIFTRLL